MISQRIKKIGLIVNNISEFFKDVEFFIHFSRHHEKVKDKKATRPRFHVFFPIDEVRSFKEYRKLKETLNQIYPYFDSGAIDAARFFYGTNNPKVMWIKGSKNLSQFLSDEHIEFAEIKVDSSLENSSNLEEKSLESNLIIKGEIPEGERNKTMLSHGNRIIFMCENNLYAHDIFLMQAKECKPPLEDNELEQIWKQCQKYYQAHKNKNFKSYIPDDFSDAGQSRVLNMKFGRIIRYSKATNFLVYKDGYWQEDDILAQKLATDLTERQLFEAKLRLKGWNYTLDKLNLLNVPKKNLTKDNLSDAEIKAVNAQIRAKQYYDYAYAKKVLCLSDEFT